jgi:hypothetical protein
MGVVWYQCEECKKTYPDCVPCGYCEGCGADLCGECLCKSEGKFGTESDGYGNEFLIKCNCCAGDSVDELVLLSYICSKYNINLEVERGEIIAQRKNEKNNG